MSILFFYRVNVIIYFVVAQRVREKKLNVFNVPGVQIPPTEFLRGDPT